MAKIIVKSNGGWKTIHESADFHTYVNNPGCGERFEIEVGSHRITLGVDEAVQLFARAFDFGAKTSPVFGDIVAAAKEASHKVLA